MVLFASLLLSLFYSILTLAMNYYYLKIVLCTAFNNNAILYPTEAILQRHRQRYKLDIVHTVRYKSL